MRPRRLLTVVALALGTVLVTAAPAVAHNQLRGSEPPADSTVDASGRTVTLRFDAPVQEGPNRLTVTGPDGNQWQVNDGSATVDGSNLTNQVRPLGPAGRYTVGYRVISADGHPLEGSLSFRLDQAGTGTPNPNVQVADSQGGSGVPVWVWVVGAVGLVGVGLCVALGVGQPSGDRKPGETPAERPDRQPNEKKT